MSVGLDSALPIQGSSSEQGREKVHIEQQPVCQAVVGALHMAGETAEKMQLAMHRLDQATTGFQAKTADSEDSSLTQVAAKAGLVSGNQDSPATQAVRELEHVAEKIGADTTLKCVVNGEGRLEAAQRGFFSIRTGSSPAAEKTLTRLALLVKTVGETGTFEEKRAVLRAIDQIKKSAWGQDLAAAASERMAIVDEGVGALLADSTLEQLQGYKGDCQQVVSQETGKLQKITGAQISAIDKAQKERVNRVGNALVEKLGKTPSVRQVMGAMVDVESQYSTEEKLFLRESLGTVVPVTQACQELKELLQKDPPPSKEQLENMKEVVQELLARGDTADIKEVHTLLEMLNPQLESAGATPFTGYNLLQELIDTPGLEQHSLDNDRRLQRAALIFDRMGQEGSEVLSRFLGVEGEQKERLAAFLEYAAPPYRQQAVSAGVVARESFDYGNTFSLKESALLRGSQREEALNVYAEDLSLLFSQPLGLVQSSEWAGQAWATSAKKMNAPGLLQAIDCAQGLVHKLVLPALFEQEEGKLPTVALVNARALFFLDLAEKCIEKGNFAAAEQIIAGLASIPVTRLLTEENKTRRNSIQATFSKDNSYKELRATLLTGEQKGQIVPCFGYAMTDFTFIDDGNLNKVDGGVNMDKMFLINQFIQTQHNLMTQGYRGQGTFRGQGMREVMHFARGDSEKSTNAFFDLSVSIKPKKSNK